TPLGQCAKRYHTQLELDIDFCNEFFYTLTEEKWRTSECRFNGRFSCVRSTRKSLWHKAPAHFSTASGENSGADGANSRQDQGVSVVPTGAPGAPGRAGTQADDEHAVQVPQRG